MIKQWNELKASITELRDSGGMGTQREVCEYLVNLMAVIEKQMQEPCDDCISRQQAIDIERNATVDTDSTHFEAHQKFIQFMDDAEISSFGRWQWSNGFNTALTAVGIDLKKLPPAEPEITSENIKKYCEKRSLVILTSDFYNEMKSRCSSAQPEQQWIPVSERLPEPYTPLLISAVQENCDFVACGTTRKVGIMHRKLEWVDDDGFPVKVVAWMPLPEPYKAERREE